MNRKILARFNFAIITVLLLFATGTVLFYENPEKILEGTWEEEGWYYEKVDNSSLFQKQDSIHQLIREQVVADLPPLRHGVWSFERQGKYGYLLHDQDKDYTWYLKGRGHILELRKEGKPIESFVIQELNNQQLVLHLNLDMQTKGIVKIVLKKESKEKEAYAKKI